jgi:hypothetical protein
MKKTTERYMPMIARCGDPVVQNFINSSNPRRLRRIVNTKRTWSVWDNETDYWMPQDANKGFQTFAGCQRLCDKLNRRPQ